MAKLIGNNPSQIPTNADLGKMAFEDKVSVANLKTDKVVTGLPTIDAPTTPYRKWLGDN